MVNRGNKKQSENLFDPKARSVVKVSSKEKSSDLKKTDFKSVVFPLASKSQHSLEHTFIVKSDQVTSFVLDSNIDNSVDV